MKNAKPGQYLAFYVQNETMGVPVECVREITQLPDIRPVPHAPEYVQGVADLRGKVVPVVNLRKMFKLPDAAASKLNCVIVLAGNQGLVGVQVDAVHEVLDLKMDSIDHTPSFITNKKNEFLIGIGKYKGQLVILLDLVSHLNVASLTQEAEPQKAAA